MGQVRKIEACPILIFLESDVQTIYQLNCLTKPRGSKIFAAKRQFLRKYRTNGLALPDRRCLTKDLIKLGRVNVTQSKRLILFCQGLFQKYAAYRSRSTTEKGPAI